MRNKTLFFIVVSLFIFSPVSFGYERINPRGPMAIRNQMPLYLFWYFFPQESARITTQQNIEADFDYTVSNCIFDKVTTPTEEYVVRADMEVNRFNINVRYGVFERFEASLEVPYLVLSRGYLDSFVEEFEDLIGATAIGARKRTDRNQFNYNVQLNYVDLINTKDPSSGLGDVALAVKYMLIDDMEGFPRTSLRSAVKFPTASEDKYHGSGKFDYGFGILMDKTFSRLVSYFNFNTVFIQGPDCFSVLNIKDYILSGMLALEYCFTERLSGIVQSTWHSTPYPKTGTDPMDNDALEVTLGFNYQFTKYSNWHIAAVENIYADSSPDVTCQLGGRMRF